MDKTWIDVNTVKVPTPDAVFILCLNYFAIVCLGWTRVLPRLSAIKCRRNPARVIRVTSQF